MTFFVISYDLREGEGYDPIIENLKANHAVRALESFWFVELAGSASEVLAHFKAYLPDASKDKLMVVPFDEKPRYTRAFTPTNEWVSARFP